MARGRRSPGHRHYRGRGSPRRRPRPGTREGRCRTSPTLSWPARPRPGRESGRGTPEPRAFGCPGTRCTAWRPPQASSERVRYITSLRPVEFEIVEELVALAPGFLRSRHRVVASGDQPRRDLHPEEAVMIVRVPLERDRVTLLVLEHGGRNEVLAVHLHDVVKVVISAGRTHDVRSLR